MRGVDVLIVTALKEEYDAAREAGATPCAGNPGIAEWQPRDVDTPTPYLLGAYALAGGEQMSMALARPTRMGGTATAPIVAALVERLAPRCLAMCGVCAGNPASVALGDVIIAEFAYAYDEGKRTQHAFEADTVQITMPDSWIRAAQELSPHDLPSFGPASPEDARVWLLERLQAEEDPRAHPAMRRYFVDGTWQARIEEWIGEGLIVRDGARLQLTTMGQSFVDKERYDDTSGPVRLPFEIAVGPMASGNVVVKDGLTWDQLKRQGMRSVLGLEMEAATIASAAHRLEVPNWVVAKGVMDYADARKDDRYKRFAARASAEVLFKFVASRLSAQNIFLNRASDSGRRPLSQSGAVPAVPRQLPLPPPYFVGREPELAMLSSILDGHGTDGATPDGSGADGSGAAGSGTARAGWSGRPRIAAIVGPGGIGKSWLALRWAHRNADRFPDGQIYLDLRSLSADDDLVTATAVRCLLDALVVDPRTVPAQLDSQIGLYRTLVADRRMLIVLDNVTDAAQVASLLPGTPSCAVIVTSRNRLDGLVVMTGATRCELWPLTDSQARELFTERVGQARVAAEPEAVASLLASCAGLPLALGVVVNRAIAQPGFPLQALAAELSDPVDLEAFDAGDPSTSLYRVFSWSYQALSPDQATAFRLLGLAPGTDIGEPAATSLLGRSSKAILRSLEQLSLVQQHSPARWQMHALVRLYAAGLPDNPQNPAVRRLVDHYLHTAYAAGLATNPSRHARIALDPPEPGTQPEPISDVASAIAWFDAESANLLAALRLAAVRGWHRTAWQLARVMDSYYWRRAHLTDRVAVWRIGLDSARHLDESYRGPAHRLLGSALSGIGVHEEALEHLQSALASATTLGDRLAEADAHRTLVRAYGRRADHKTALDHAIAALRLYQAVGTPSEEADALDLICWTRAQLGQYEEAEVAGRAALDLYRGSADTDGEATVLDTLGYIAQGTGRYADAAGHYRQTLELFGGRNPYHEADTLSRLGEAYAAAGEHEQARRTWEQSLDLYTAQQRTHDANRIQRRLSEPS